MKSLHRLPDRVIHLALPTVLLAALIAPFSMVSGATLTTDQLRTSHCFAEIDQALTTYSRGRSDEASQQFSALLASCGSIPHLHHNLGVLAAESQQWEIAIEHFENSLDLDKRASMTQTSLATIYRYKAGSAYRTALKLNTGPIKLPVLHMQSSAIQNKSDVFCPASAIVTLQTQPVLAYAEPGPQSELATQADPNEVAFDVHSWWTALQEQNHTAFLSHYAPAVKLSTASESTHWRTAVVQSESTLPEWSDVNINIDILDEHALVMLEYLPVTAFDSTSGHNTAHSLLVLKKSDLQWQIVKEQLW